MLPKTFILQRTYADRYHKTNVALKDSTFIKTLIESAFDKFDTNVEVCNDILSQGVITLKSGEKRKRKKTSDDNVSNN